MSGEALQLRKNEIFAEYIPISLMFVLLFKGFWAVLMKPRTQGSLHEMVLPEKGFLPEEGKRYRCLVSRAGEIYKHKGVKYSVHYAKCIGISTVPNAAKYERNSGAKVLPFAVQLDKMVDKAVLPEKCDILLLSVISSRKDGVMFEPRRVEKDASAGGKATIKFFNCDDMAGLKIGDHCRVRVRSRRVTNKKDRFGNAIIEIRVSRI